MKKILKISFLSVLSLAGFILLLSLGINIYMLFKTEGRVFDNIEDVPHNDVALILGTSKYNRNGTVNQYFKNRIEAAVNLYNAGKVKHFLVSGDNALVYYNEPADMKKALVLAGVPPEIITLDYAGFRTFDSVVRSKKVFGRDKITVISQDFHCNRALYIGDYFGIEGIAFCTEPVPGNFTIVMRIREYFARCLTIADLYLLEIEPRFLGEKIEINID